MINITRVSSPSEWKILGKGNANVVYRYEGSDKRLRRKVLRVRLLKSPENYISTLELQNFVKTRCSSIPKKHMIKTDLVHISDKFLKRLETRDFELMISEKFALLMENILYGNFKSLTLSKHCRLHMQFVNELGQPDSVILELKPKWLYDCTTNYCRNCALNQQRMSDRHFCPLDFLHQSRLEVGVDDLLSRLPRCADLADLASNFRLRQSLIEYLASEDNIFQELKRLQAVSDAQSRILNVKSPNEIPDTLLYAMTMRDVGVFLNFKKTPCDVQGDTDFAKANDHKSYAVTACVYDLDVKSKTKFDHWRTTELLLQDYYNACDSDWRPCVRTS